MDYVNYQTLWNYYTAAVHEFISAHDANHNTIADERGTGDIFLGVASYNESRSRVFRIYIHENFSLRSVPSSRHEP